MSKTIHLISDLHLCEEHSHLFELFKFYMQNIAPNSQQLIVLGDLFDVWIGDDHATEFNQNVIRLFNHYSNNHGELLIAHGNRDFLLGQKFADSCDGKLIEEPFNFKWQNKNICLMHGDSLCTDDVAYQEFKNMVRTNEWQTQFLSLPIEKRLEIASGIKQQSKDAQREKQAEIMDVNSSAVNQCFIDNQCDWLIHGHTHREGQHQIDLSEDKAETRIVLSDWDKQGHYLELKDQHFQSIYFLS